MEIKGIAQAIVDNLVDRSVELSQGRPVGAVGFVNQSGYIDTISQLADGGLSGLPYRQLLGGEQKSAGKSLLELVNCLPDNAVLIRTNPGKTGLITSMSGIDVFNLPVINIGVKNLEAAGVGILYPRGDYFDLATRSEQIDLKKLSAQDMEEERQILQEASQLRLNYLSISQELPVVELDSIEVGCKMEPALDWQLPRLQVKSIAQDFVDQLVAKSTEIEQGREVAAMGVIEEQHVVQAGELVVGGIGYIPSRLLASGYTTIDRTSLREVYSTKIPQNAVVVHTHPGGTGVMHRGDAMAGPGMWGRPVISIGHDKRGMVKGATVIKAQDRVNDLADEYESVGQEYYQAETTEEETAIRNRRFSIAQEYTNLCQEINI